MTPQVWIRQKAWERAVWVYRAHQSGLTYRKISILMGISVGRAQQLGVQGEQRLRSKRKSPLEKWLGEPALTINEIRKMRSKPLCLAAIDSLVKKQYRDWLVP